MANTPHARANAALTNSRLLAGRNTSDRWRPLETLRGDYRIFDPDEPFG